MANFKILHILYSGLGGHGNVFFSMVDGDKQNEFCYEALFYGIENVRQAYIEKSEERYIKWNYIKKKAGFDLASYKKIVKLIKESESNVIFLHTSAFIFPAIWAKFFAKQKIKIVVRETQPNHLKTKLEWVGLAVALITANKVVFLSKEYCKVIKDKLPIFFSNKRTTVIPNGIDLNYFKPTNKQLETKQNKIINIGMQSRLSETKDHATLIEAFALLVKKNNPNNAFVLNIAGDGECYPTLKNLAHSLGISDKIQFVGMLDEKDLVAFINDQDIYVHATLGETMSTAIMQVMACCKPIIASDVLGVNNMIKHNDNGLLVPAKNSMALCEAMNFLLGDVTISNKLSENAYQYAKKYFSNEMMLVSYKNIFLE